MTPNVATTTLQAPPEPRQDDETDRISEVESKAAAKVRKVAGTTEARIAEKDAESDRKIRARQADLDLRERETKLKQTEDQAKAAAKAAKKTATAARRTARRRARADRAVAAYTCVRDYIAGNMPGVYSTVIYAMALYVAVSGQLNMATERGWNPVFGVGLAVFLEGMALSMALTANQMRLAGERALIPTIATWGAASFASAINYLAHRDDPILAVVLGASSLAAIIVWEVRSGAKHRAELRANSKLPEPPERFGLRRWLRYPRETWAAWSLDVKRRVSAGAALLIAEVQEERQTATAATSAEAALDSECAAETARQAADEAAAAATRGAEQARAAAAEAVKAAKRAARPHRTLRERFARNAKDTAAEPAPAAAPALPPAKAPAALPTAPAVPKAKAAIEPKREPKAPTESGDNTKTLRDEKLLDAWSSLELSLGRFPSVSELSETAKIPRSTCGDWRKIHVAKLKEGASA